MQRDTARVDRIKKMVSEQQLVDLDRMIYASEIQVGPVQRIDLPPLYVKDSYAFGLKGAFMTAKDAL